MSESKTFMVENAQVIFRNFSGKEGKYNREGDRNFAVILEPETALTMLEDDWNVKYLQPREEDEEPTAYVQVSVNFNSRPPRVVMISSRARTHIGEDMIDILDWADFGVVDLIARGYEWSVNGKTGVKAYLQSLFVTVVEDELELKYSVDPEE